MRAFVLTDHFAGEAHEMLHAVILRETLVEAAQAVNAEILLRRGNRASVCIPRYHIPALNIPTLTFRLHTRERVDESFMSCLGIYEVLLIP